MTKCGDVVRMKDGTVGEISAISSTDQTCLVRQIVNNVVWVSPWTPLISVTGKEDNVLLRSQ